MMLRGAGPGAGPVRRWQSSLAGSPARHTHLGKTSLPFVERATGRNVVRITRALAVGPVRLVSGADPLEGCVFDALLLQTGAEQFQLLGHWGREQSERVPPACRVAAFESDP